jgi:hypothetical protein
LIAIDDYERKYPPDAKYEEGGPTARLWRVYLDEAQAFDTDMISEMREALDLLLIFVRDQY